MERIYNIEQRQPEHQVMLWSLANSCDGGTTAGNTFSNDYKKERNREDFDW